MPPTLASAIWIDNIAGYHKLFVNAGADDHGARRRAGQ